MKKFTFEYVPHLGDFLDERGIKWINEGNNIVSIFYNIPADLFLLAVVFKKWKEKYNL